MDKPQKLEENVKDYFDREKKITAGLSVGSVLENKMEIYGFIPCAYDENESCLSLLGRPLLEYKAICADRIVFENVEKIEWGEKRLPKIYPIYRAMVVGVKKKIPLLNIYVPDLLSRAEYINYRKLGNRREASPVMMKKLQEVEQISIENDADSGVLYYTTELNQIVFFRSKNFIDIQIAAVARQYMIVCRWINSITGRINYGVYSPEDLKLVYNATGIS